MTEKKKKEENYLSSSTCLPHQLSEIYWFVWIFLVPPFSFTEKISVLSNLFIGYKNSNEDRGRQNTHEDRESNCLACLQWIHLAWIRYRKQITREMFALNAPSPPTSPPYQKWGTAQWSENEHFKRAQLQGGSWRFWTTRVEKSTFFAEL